MSPVLWKNPFNRTRRRSHEPVELSERKLDKVIQAVAALQNGADPARVSPRLPVHARVTILPFAHGRTGRAREVGLYDISAAGVAVIDSRPMTPGTQFKLVIPRRLRRPIEVLCTVRHCRQSDDGFILGAEYGVSWLDTLGTLVGPRTTNIAPATEAVAA